MAVNRWQCPQCKRTHEKRYVFGAPTPHPSGHATRTGRHPDVTCPCGKVIAGEGIGLGYYDIADDPLAPLPHLARAILGSAMRGAVVGGGTYFFTSGNTAIIVGVCAFVFYVILFFAGALNIKP